MRQIQQKWISPVTQKHINLGKPKSCTECMGALSLHDAPPPVVFGRRLPKLHRAFVRLNEIVTIHGKPGTERVRAVWHMPKSSIRPILLHDYQGKKSIKPWEMKLTLFGDLTVLKPLTEAQKQANRDAQRKKRADEAAAVEAAEEAGLEVPPRSPRTRYERVMGI